MKNLPVSWDALTVATVFVANSVGSVLATYCLVRMTDSTRSQGKRLMLAAFAAFVLLETARDDMFLTLAAAKRPSATYLLYAMKPDLVVIVFVLSIVAALLLAVVRWPSRVVIVLAGAVTGFAMAFACTAALRTVRADQPVSLETTPIAWLSFIFAIVVSVAFWLSVGATRRPPVASSIMLLSIGLTALQLMFSHELSIVSTASTDITVAGRSPALVIVLTLAAFLARMVILTIVSLTDTRGLPRPAPSDPALQPAGPPADPPQPVAPQYTPLPKRIRTRQ